jgi:uncharacterized membrane protein YhaH (DUF805 family)
MEYVTAMGGFEGRLPRKPYWIAGILLLLALLIVFALITFVTVATMDAGLAYWLAALVQLAITYPASAIMVKRFHDLNKSGKWTLLLVVPAIVYSVTNALGWTGRPISLDGVAIDFEANFFSIWLQSIAIELKQQPIDFLFDAWLFLVGLWFLIELGFFRGTRGQNAYGPDPLPAAAASS